MRSWARALEQKRRYHFLTPMTNDFKKMTVVIGAQYLMEVFTSRLILIIFCFLTSDNMPFADYFQANPL